ncbi:MAG: HAD family hydrolase, partial [Actinomycetota bacterium]
MACTVVFDVNETLLSLDPVRAWFTSRFDHEPSAKTWFGELLRLSFVSATTDRYLPFPELGAVALRTVADRSAQTLEDDDLSYISSVFTMLPAHPDVASGIDHLRAAGFTIAALTNSPLGTATEQLHNAGLADRFDSVMSVELVERFKPHVSVYRAAAA